jgi:signal transduction histidine kinase
LKSLRGRLAAGLLGALLLTFTLLGAGLGAAVRTVVEGYMTTRLDHDAESLLAAVELPATGPPRLDPARIGTAYRRVYSGHYYVLLSGGHRLTSRSLWLDTLEAPATAPGETRTLRVAGPQGAPLLLRVRGFRKDGRDLRIAVAEDLAPVEAQVRRWQRGFAAAMALALLALLTAQAWILRHALAPLERVRAELGELERGERRALGTDVPAEAAGLVAEVNRLLLLLGERLERSRKAAGNLAHALKGPLGVAGRIGEDLGPPAGPALREQLARVQASIDRELARARVMGDPVAGRRFDTRRDLPDLVDTVVMVHRDRSLHVEVRGGDAGPLPVEHQDMVELLGNLLDNACKWARSRVRLTLRWDADLHVVVEDDGPGVAPGERMGLGGRGTRLDEGIRGHGLGLAICSDIAASYGGTLSLDDSGDLGGLAVTVMLPAGARAPAARAPQR